MMKLMTQSQWQGAKKSKAAVNFEAATLADALKDCSTDAGDNCNNFLHPNGV